MYRYLLALMLLSTCVLAAQSAAEQGRSQTRATWAGDSLSVIRAQYLAEVNELLPQLRAAERATAIADSLEALRLPTDTVVAGTMRWLIDESETPLMQDALTLAWSHLHRVFGSETRILSGPLYVARIRSGGWRDTSRKTIDLAEVTAPGHLNIFDRLRDDEEAEVIAARVSRRGARTIMRAGDPDVITWLMTPVDPTPLREGNRELMYVDLVTAPSQVASRCLSGDLNRCRDALGLVDTADPLTQWYDAPERRLLVMRMRDHLARGPLRAEYIQCVDRHSYSTCDRMLRSTPAYVVPPALPPSSRQHLFRLAIAAGGADAYSRFAARADAAIEERLAAASGMPIDSLVAHWRADLIAARPPSPVPPMRNVWTTVAWGIAIMLLALRVVSWR